MSTVTSAATLDFSFFVGSTNLGFVTHDQTVSTLLRYPVRSGDFTTTPDAAHRVRGLARRTLQQHS